MKGVEYIMLEDKAYQIKACCGSDDLGQKEKGGSRLISVPSDPVSRDTCRWRSGSTCNKAAAERGR